MNRDNRILGLIGIATKAGKVIAGSEAVEEAIINKKAKLVIVTKDASARTKDHIKRYCEQNKIMFSIFGVNEEMSKAIGKANKAVICIKDKNLGEEIYKIICGGEAIG